MHQGTKEMITLAISQVQLNGGTIEVVNGLDKYAITYKAPNVVIEKF